MAFSYRDFAAEARFLRSLFEHRRARAAESFLELAAGPARHAIEMLREGLRGSALDCSPAMVAYGRARAAELRLPLEYDEGDMTRFEVRRPFDLAACMLCSASYLLTDDAFQSHLECVRRALSPDGMYVLELSHPAELTGVQKSNSSWRIRDSAGELEMTWGGEPTEGIFLADVRLVFRPFDGSAPVEVIDQARQRGYDLPELVRLAERSGFSSEVVLGGFDERLALADPKAYRMILGLKPR